TLREAENGAGTSRIQFMPIHTVISSRKSDNELKMKRGPTLRISVAADDHSHLIGKGGQSHKLLQTRTNTRVHFPERVASPELHKTGSRTEDEVLLYPADALMKTEPWASEEQLVHQFFTCRKLIRQNQLLIYRLFVPSTTWRMDYSKVQKMCMLSQQALSQKILLSSQQHSDYTIIAVRGTMRQSSEVIQVTTEVQKVFPSAVYNTLCLPSVHWRDLILVASTQVIKDFNLPSDTAPEAAFASFLCTVGVMPQFHNGEIISLQGQDATRVLEVKQRLIQALPLSLVLPNSLTLSCNITNAQVLAKVQRLYGVRIGSGSNCGRIVLETHEANFAALFDVRWLLSLEDPMGFLARVNIHSVWSVGSPRTFAELEESEPQKQTKNSLVNNIEAEISGLSLAFSSTFHFDDSLLSFIGSDKMSDSSMTAANSGGNGGGADFGPTGDGV
uniref:KH_dom_type_1 domain-containing protein n=1 Tax=Macrostomum lignano TaxID=282301 RepID=A0A1I8IK53_9PLAT